MLPLRRLLPPVLILLVALAVHLPQLKAPFGPGEINGGIFFGPFVQTWDHLGIVACRGVPLACSPYADPASASAYLHHPPGAFWVHWLFGAQEWQLRIPGILAMLASALLLYALVKPAGGVLAATSAACALLLLPVIAVYARVSYEPLVLALGLFSVFAFEQSFHQPRQSLRRVAKVSLLAAVFCAVWMDWAGLFFALGLFVLLPGKPRADALRLAALALATAILAAASVFVWQVWAVHAPALGVARATMDLGSILNAAVMDSPGAAEALTNLAQRLLEGSGGLLPLLAALPGLVMLSSNALRITLALLIPAALNVLIFRRHAEVHVFYFAYFAPALAIALGYGSTYVRRFPIFTFILALTWCVPLTLACWSGQSAASHPFFRDLGALFDKETCVRNEAGETVGTNKVHTNLPYAYSYYYRTPGVVCGSNSQALAQELEHLDQRAGLRFVHCDLQCFTRSGQPAFPDEPALLSLLSQHSSRTEPSLMGPVPDPQGLLHTVVLRTRVFRIRDPLP